MAKIGTAHIEIKPVLNEDALAIIVEQIKDAVQYALSDPDNGAKLIDRGLMLDVQHVTNP